MRRRTIALGAVAVAACTSSGPAYAASPAVGTLNDPGGAVMWQGGGGWETPAVRPEACLVVRCDEFILSIDLPRNVWRDAGGVQVGVRWGHEGEDLDLYVYAPDGSLAASSAGVYGFAAAQSVVLPAAPNGRYRVVVVPVNVSEPALTYAGRAEVERPPHELPVRDLLPNLVALPPANPKLATGAYYSPEGAGEAVSCYPEETAEQGARRCLRFDQAPANLGNGPLELRYLMTAPDDPQLRQRIYRSDGTYRDRRADRWEFHPTHGHFHYARFMSSRLWASDRRARRIGDEPVRTGRKNGFCLIDVDNVAFGSKGDAAKTYYFPRCNAPTDSDASGLHMTNGISVGWADVYPWFLPDQYIEVSGVPDGYYLLESIVDPDDTVLEADETDNQARVLIELQGGNAEVVRSARRAVRSKVRQRRNGRGPHRREAGGVAVCCVHAQRSASAVGD